MQFYTGYIAVLPHSKALMQIYCSFQLLYRYFSNTKYGIFHMQNHIFSGIVIYLPFHNLTY